MTWRTLNGLPLIDNGMGAIHDDCCCGVACCANCSSLLGLAGTDLCYEFIAPGAQTSVPGVMSAGTPDVDGCPTWNNPGNVNWNDPTCADFNALDVDLRCGINGNPEVMLGHPGNPDCNLPTGVWTAADVGSLQCGTPGIFEGKWTFTITNTAGCTCTPLTLTLKIYFPCNPVCGGTCTAFDGYTGNLACSVTGLASADFNMVMIPPTAYECRKWVHVTGIPWYDDPTTQCGACCDDFLIDMELEYIYSGGAHHPRLIVKGPFGEPCEIESLNVAWEDSSSCCTCPPPDFDINFTHLVAQNVPCPGVCSGVLTFYFYKI